MLDYDIYEVFFYIGIYGLYWIFVVGLIWIKSENDFKLKYFFWCYYSWWK